MEIKDLIKHIAQALVDNPSQVEVSEVEGEKTSVIELKVAMEDLGKVIGTQGRTARAMRKDEEEGGLRDHRMSPRLIAIGRLVTTKGVSGQVKVITYSGQGDSLKMAKRVFVKPRGKEMRSLTPLSIKPDRGGFRLKFQEVKTLEEAKDLVGAPLFLEREALPPPEEGEYYWFQLLGLEVYTEKGGYLGRIKGIIPTGSNDVLVVRRPGKELLLPATYDVVKEVDIDGGRMEVTLLEGLIEDAGL